MASLGLRPPQFSEDSAWLPSWLHNSITFESTLFLNHSQLPFNHLLKDVEASQENCNDCEEINTISKEEGRYKSCHLFLSGEDNSLVSVAPSHGNDVFHFSLHLSSDVDSLSLPTQDLNESREAVTLSEVQSLQPVQTSVNLGENLNYMIDHHACDQNMLPDFVPETQTNDDSKSRIDTIGSARQKKEKSDVKRFEGDDISNAVELSIAASEALVIHDLIKAESVSETICADAVLEAALCVKQARLKALDDGFHSSSEESDHSDSLSDLNDFLMEDAYQDIGLPLGVSTEENIRNSAISQAIGVSGAENYSGRNKKQSDRELTSQHADFDKCKQKQLEVEMEMQQRQDPSLDSLCCEWEMHPDVGDSGSDTPRHFENDLTTSHQFIQNDSNVLALNQNKFTCHWSWSKFLFKPAFVFSVIYHAIYAIMDFSILILCFCSLSPSWKELDSSSLNQNNAERIPKIFVRETSFLSESADIVPDESSCVQKADPMCTSGSQLSMPSEGSHNKLDECTLHSQDVVRCSSLSLIDPLCSVVPCSFSSESANFKTHIDKENDSENLVPFISELVDNFQRAPDKNVTFDCRDEKIMPVVLLVKDIPNTAIKVVDQMPDKLTMVEHTCQKQFNPLQTCSIMLPNQALNLNNLTPLPTNQSMSAAAAASFDTMVSENLFASKHTDEKQNDEKHGHFVDHKSIIETIDGRSADDLKLNASDAICILAEPIHEKKSPLNLNRKRCHPVLGPKTGVNDISVEKRMNHHVISETVVQYQQNNDLNKLQAECNEFHDGCVSVRKRVCFSEKVEEIRPKRKLSKLELSYKKCSSVRAKRQRISMSLTPSMPNMNHSLTNYCRRVVNDFIFQGTEFLLTGLSSQKERDMEALIRKSGGVVLSDIPLPPNSRDKRCSTLSCLELPIILCIRKVCF
ncbi:putative BRCT domain-containing protein [Lupinus albus]|uniref:Putative BRCT domain-containing protein n=1 Tax=Lupinus albus TaxID=3870 RepID=A0A6A4NIM2_LUPAL|nr:putative BRCT domain-containing protein [Lupinus albus]